MSAVYNLKFSNFKPMNYMNKNKIILIATIAFLFIAIGFAGTFFITNQEYLTENTSENSQRIRSAEKDIADATLLFFLDPKGRPCQMQARIINENKGAIEKYAQIRYIVTSDSSNRSVFYHYGIRGIPSMIVLNSDQSIAHRFPPGIHSITQLLKNLQTVK